MQPEEEDSVEEGFLEAKFTSDDGDSKAECCYSQYDSE